MKKILFILLILPLLFACGSKKPLYHDSQGSDIIAFGDSLTYGLGVYSEHSYPSVLAELSGKKVINLGVSGNTARQGADRISDINKYRPRMVLVEFGGNDLLKGRPIQETEAALNEIVDYVYGLQAMVVLVDTGGNYQMNRYTKMMKRIAKEKHTLYIDGIMNDIFKKKDLKSDVLHPNEKGYKMIAEKVYKHISPYLAEQTEQ